MDNYIGKLLDDRYEILEKIGSGGMAVVYKARCHRLNRLVAIKILKEELSSDAEFRRRFYAESQAVAMLSHPNIVSVYDVSHSDNLDYIVMELIEGITLKQYLEQKGKLNWREALHFSTQIAKALEHAHSRGIVHRDIKPHNIMILKDGSVKVADFGIARVSSAQNTLTREALGSVHYISPEQAKGARVDNRADLYSLGVVMYEMLTGRPPYDAETPVGVAIQHINGTPVMPRELEPTIPEGLEQITMHAMTASLAGRYPTATRMLHDLEEFRKDPNVVFDFSGEEQEIDVQRLIHDPTYMPEGLGRTSVIRKKTKQPAQESTGKQEKPQTDSGRRSRIAVIAGTVCIILAVILLLYFLYIYFISDLFRKTEEIRVPNFVGMYAADIDPSKYPDFILDMTDHAESSEYESGRVMDQSPDADDTVKVGTTIRLTISAGASDVLMPNVINASRQNAQSMLDALPIRLSISIEERNSDLYTEGYVIESQPSFGAVLSEGQTVTLVVSKGPEIELKTVPACVGEDVENALRMIDEAGLSQGSLRYDESDQPKGTVLFQSINAGEKVKENTVINLRVSKGPQEAKQPLIYMLSDDQQVAVGDPLVLAIQAKTDDDGVLRYAWYRSTTGNTIGAELVSRSSENNTTCAVDTSQPGTYYFYCTVENTLGESKASVTSDMVEVIVVKQSEPHDFTFSVTLPSAPGEYMLSVELDGEEVLAPVSVEVGEDGERSINITVTGTGVQRVDVLIGGEIYESYTIDFDMVG